MKRSSSETGPAVMPSGGEMRRALYSWKSRFEATELDMVGYGCVWEVWFRLGLSLGGLVSSGFGGGIGWI